MTELEILLTGEVYSDGQPVGRVRWTRPFAEMDGAGEWARPDDDLPELLADCRATIAAARAALDGDGSDTERVQRVRRALELPDGETE